MKASSYLHRAEHGDIPTHSLHALQRDTFVELFLEAGQVVFLALNKRGV